MNPLNLIKNLPAKPTISALAGILVLVLCWFVLPHIALSGTHPFASPQARILIMVLIALAWSARHIINFFQQHKSKAFSVVGSKTKSLSGKVKNTGQSVWKASKYNVTELKYKIKRDQRRRRLRRVPWYLVLGSPQSGKKTMMKNTGLYFARPEHFGEEAVNYINQLPDFEWWFSEQAILIDAMSSDVERDQNAWQQFLKLLKRERKRRPLNGIILNFSLPDLLLHSNQKRQNFMQDVCRYIRSLHETFKSLVPIYIVFTKCDLVEGFMEFFNDLSKEELRQVWGVQFPFAECSNLQSVQTHFTKEYSSLVNQLKKRIIWALDTERTERGRELINAFPQQMQLFKRSIDNFIAELFGGTRYPKALQLRGLFFTSCTQDTGESMDFVMQAMSKKFQLVPPKFQRPQRFGECYFMQSLFLNTIYPEASVLGFSEKSKKIRQLTYRLLLFSFPVILILLGTGMYKGYNENKQYLQVAQQNIHQYNERLASIGVNNAKLTSTLPALDALNATRNLYQNSDRVGLHLLFTTYSIKHRINDALERSLHSIFLPRIAAALETELNQNIQNLNLLYATFKGYLAFSDNAYTGRQAIKAPMEYQWNQAFLNNPNTDDKLRSYLQLALRSPVEKLPLDNNLIANIRSQLEQVIPSKRAYGLLELKAKVSNLPNLIIPAAVGSNFGQIFTISPQNHGIANLYTRSGFENIYTPKHLPIAREVALDNKDIGLVNDSDETQTAGQINTIMETTYNTRYLQNWDIAIDQIQIKPFTNLSDAITTLNLLIGKQSPFAKLLHIINDNTSTIDSTKVNVKHEFTAINDYTQNSGKVTWSATVKTLTQIRDYLVKLQQSPNQTKAAFDEAVLAMKGSKSPIQQLALEASEAPQPIKSWLNAIADNAWQIVVQGAHQYMNDAWENDVVPTYNSGIRDRYPLSRRAVSQIALTDFDAFFSSGGVLETYFDKYVKPFVNTTTKPWALYKVNNHSIEMPKQNVLLFERAATIRQDFFPHKAKSAHFSFSIEPMVLTSNASSIQFNVGNQHLVYSHGPQNVSEVGWPLPFNQQQASIIITDFHDNQFTRSANGPWAVFRLFDYGDLRRMANNGTYRFNIDLNGYYASYRITGSDNLRLFNLADLKGFYLPGTIAPNTITSMQAKG